MAKDTQERTYTIPLRKAILKVPRYKRAKRAMSEIRIFLKRHLKVETVKIGQHLNIYMWRHGIKNPPTKVKVNAIVDEEGVGWTELFGKPVLPPTEEEIKEEKKKEKAEAKKEEKETKKEVKKAPAKKKGDEPKLGRKALQKQLEEDLKAKEEKEKKAAAKPAASAKGPKKDKVPSAHELAKKKEAKK